MTRLREILGGALRRRRLAGGRSLREVAGCAGVSLTYLSEVERGVKEPSSEILEAIAAALGVPLSDLLLEAAGALLQLEQQTARPATAMPQPVVIPAAEPGGGRVLDFQAYAGRRSA